MKEFFKRLQIKGFVIGVLATIMLSGILMVAANTVTETREVTFGIRVMLNGEIVDFDDIDRPFVTGSRTFLPLRALAELLGLPVDFDPATNMAILGQAETAPPTIPDSVPIGDLFTVGGSSGFVEAHNADVIFVDSVTIATGTHTNAVLFSSNEGRWNSDNRDRVEQSALFNLDGNFRWLTGDIGRVVGSYAFDAAVRIYGDGRLLFEEELPGGGFPAQLSLFVEDIRLLRVELIYGLTNHSPPPQNEFRYAIVGHFHN